MDISVIIPLFNEEESLPELYAWIERVMKANGFSFEVIFVNDGSTDHSWQVIQRLGSESDHVKGIKFRRNYGKSPALYCGFKAAEGDVVVTMDADLQDSPDEIPGLYNMITREGFDGRTRTVVGLSVALGVVFVLNGIALFIFPYIGDALGMTMKQFGMWAAIAIHDTSSVVGAGAAYDQMHPELVAQQGVSALEVATTIKLTRALWIVVLALVTPFFFRKQLAAADGTTKPWYSCVPRFIIWFVVAILFNTYVLSNAALIGDTAAEIGTLFSGAVNKLAKNLITLSLFFIGASLTRETLRCVGLNRFCWA